MRPVFCSATAVAAWDSPSCQTSEIKRCIFLFPEQFVCRVLYQCFHVPGNGINTYTKAKQSKRRTTTAICLISAYLRANKKNTSAAHKQTNRQRDKQPNGQTDRQTSKRPLIGDHGMKDYGWKTHDTGTTAKQKQSNKARHSLAICVNVRMRTLWDTCQTNVLCSTASLQVLTRVCACVCVCTWFLASSHARLCAKHK